MGRILILGADGYLGWPTGMYLSAKGHEVGFLDSGVKKVWEKQHHALPLFPIPMLPERLALWDRPNNCHFYGIDIMDENSLQEALIDFAPDTIIHYAEQPSAPFSMASLRSCIETQRNNVLGTLNLLWLMRAVCPEAHLVKLGTMGEYGTPNIDIEEGYLDVEHNGRRAHVLFPKKPGSFYHLSKVHDSHNLFFACNTWGLRATDLNQGVVYGIETEEMSEEGEFLPERMTSFHYDAVFGTALNRFCVQAVVGEPLTVYGTGAQKRAFLNIRDTLRCVELACGHPAEPGQMRVFNQFTEVFSVLDLAELVQESARALGIHVEIAYLENPRVESAEHYYNPKAEKLLKLGLKPTMLGDELITSMLVRIQKKANSANREAIKPKVCWR